MADMTKIALAIILKPDDREAELLERLLSGKVTEFATAAQKEIDVTGVSSLADAVDAIYITIAGNTTNVKCEEVAKKYGAIVSHYKWNNNFADARNFNFSQVPEEFGWIIWADADDVVRNPQLIKPILKQCQEEIVDIVVLNYLYDFDAEGNCNVKHLKTRIVKNDNCVKWAGELHEDFANNRQLLPFNNEEIEFIHLTDPKRIENSAIRNRMIAELSVQNNPTDPRVYWNLANTYMLIGKLEEAANIFLQFLQISNSDEEKFLSWYRLAMLYEKLGKQNYAIEAALEALALRPWYPDAYFLLGELNFVQGKYRPAREFLETGMTKELRPMESIVWNPLDYTYNPKLILAQVYAVLNLPKEAIKQLEDCIKIKPKSKYLQKFIDELKTEVAKFDYAEALYKKAQGLKNTEDIKKILDEVPDEMKYYPMIISLRNKYFIKTESSGKDIVFYCGNTAHEWNSDVARDKGVGGSEEAVIQLAKRFVKAGYNVTIYASTPKQQEFVIDGVIWKPYMGWNYRDKQDIVIIWRHPKASEYPINAPKIYLDMHDMVPPEEFTIPRIKSITKILFKSKTQRDYYPQVPDDKCLIIPHGLDIEEFESQRKDIKKDEYLILNTSSPDRGIKTCMNIIKKVYDKLPDELKGKLKFAQYYGFDVWDTEFETDNQMMQWKSDVLKQIEELQALGIMTTDSGVRKSQSEITRKYLEAGVLLYPSEFPEIGFIGNMKGMLAGCIPFTTDIFAQGEFTKEGFLVHSDIGYNDWNRDIRTGLDYGVQKEEQINKFVDGLVSYIKDPLKYDDMRIRLIKYAKDTFDWDKTSQMWLEAFNK